MTLVEYAKIIMTCMFAHPSLPQCDKITPLATKMSLSKSCIGTTVHSSVQQAILESVFMALKNSLGVIDLSCLSPCSSQLGNDPLTSCRQCSTAHLHPYCGSHIALTL